MAIGWYCDILPSGQSVKLFKDEFINFNGTNMPLVLGQNLLFIDISPDGTKFAGVIHDGPHRDEVYQYADGYYKPVTDAAGNVIKAFGPQSVRYRPDGTLYVIQSAPAVGIRYWQGDQPVSCDATRADLSRGIWDFTELPSCTIGQGGAGPFGEDPLIVIIDGVRRRIQTGTNRFVKAREESGLVSIACVREDVRSSSTAIYTLDQLRSFPEFPYVKTAPEPQPEPPKPDPEPAPIENREADIAQIRAAYPDRLGDQHWKFLVEVGQLLPAKLFRKESGTKIYVPPLDLSVSQDIIVYKDHWVDILIDGDGIAKPAWDAHPFAGEPEKWIDVSGIELDGQEGPQEPPGDDPEPPPDPTQSSDLEQVLEAILERLEAIEGVVEILDETQRKQGAVIAELVEEAARPRSLTAKCGRSIGHTHLITVTET